MEFLFFVGLVIAILLIRKNNNEKKEEAERARQERYEKEKNAKELALAEEMTKSPMTQKILREIHSRPIADISSIEINSRETSVYFIKGSRADSFSIYYHDEGFSYLTDEKVTALGRIIYCSLNCSTKFKAEYRRGSYHITREYSSW